MYLSGILSRGVNSIMLSDETTIGANPVRTIELVRKLAERYG
jgi:pyruvate kinase